MMSLKKLVFLKWTNKLWRGTSQIAELLFSDSSSHESYIDQSFKKKALLLTAYLVSKIFDNLKFLWV